MQNFRRLAILYLVIASILWSTGGLLIKLVPWHPIAISGLRSGIAAFVLIIFWHFRYKQRIPRPNKNVILGGINYMLLVILFVGANKLTTSANAILLQFTAPVWLLLIGLIFYRDPITKLDFFTVLIVFAGMSLFFIGDLNPGNMLGNFIAILSGICMGIMTLNLNKLRKHRPIEIVLWGNIFTFIAAVPFYFNLEWSLQAITGITLLGVFQLGIAYIFYTAGVQSVTPIEGILIPVIEPLLNPIWVFIGTGEQPSIYGLIGGAIVLSAIVIRNYISAAALKKEVL